MSQPKVPRQPSGPLVRAPSDLVTVQPVLWRIHRSTLGDHVLAWDGSERHRGPASDLMDADAPFAVARSHRNLAIRNRAAAALTAAPRPTCRAWARAIRSQWPELDGLHAPSTMTGSATIALCEPAASSMPDLPDFSRPPAHPLLWTLVRQAATGVGYEVI